MQLVWRDMPIGKTTINTSLTAAETAELQTLAVDGDVLEVGSAYGFSTVALALVARSVVAVDPHQTHGSYGELVHNLTANGLRDKVDIRVNTSQQTLPALADDDRRFDLIWIDGDHSPEGVEHDVTWALKLLKSGGVIACHDYDEVTCPGVRQALDKLFGGPGDLTDTLAVYRGLA
jgi:predicted O-methyltransferase YrrM